MQPPRVLGPGPRGHQGVEAAGHSPCQTQGTVRGGESGAWKYLDVIQQSSKRAGREGPCRPLVTPALCPPCRQALCPGAHCVQGREPGSPQDAHHGSDSLAGRPWTSAFPFWPQFPQLPRDSHPCFYGFSLASAPSRAFAESWQKPCPRLSMGGLCLQLFLLPAIDGLGAESSGEKGQT